MKILKILSLWGSQTLIVFFNLGVQLFLARLFTQEDVGTYFSIIALLNITATIGQFGLNKYLLVIYAKYKNISIKSKNSIIFLFVSLNLLGLFIYFLFSYFFYGNNLIFALLIIPLFLSNNLMAIYTTLIQVNSQYINISLNKLIVPLIKVVSIIVVGILWNGYLIFLGASIFILSSSFCIYLGVCIKQSIKTFLNVEIIPTEESKKLESKRQTLVIIFPYAILNLTFMIYTQGNTFLVGAIDSKTGAALFANAYLILNSIYIFPTIIYQKVLAHNILSLMYTEKNKMLALIINYLKQLFIIGSIAIVLFLYLISEDMILLLFGNSYRESIIIFQLLLIALPFRLISISMGTIMSSDFFIKKRMWVEIIVTTINIILNLILISQFGIYGATLSVIITEILLAISFSYFVDKYYKIPISRNYIYLLLIIPFLYISFNFGIIISIIIFIATGLLLIIYSRKLITLLRGGF